jgi:hypothetical protein
MGLSNAQRRERRRADDDVVQEGVPPYHWMLRAEDNPADECDKSDASDREQ